jgi:hypothetical protein
MKNVNPDQHKRHQTPKRLRHPMKRDGLSASAYMKYNLPWSCEDCSHLDTLTDTCTIGYQASLTRKAIQQHEYITSGQMTVCRFQEID